MLKIAILTWLTELKFNFTIHKSAVYFILHQIELVVKKSFCFLFFQFAVFNMAFGQHLDTLRIRAHQLLIADTLVAKFVRVDDLDKTVSGYSMKQIAVVFEREQFLRKHGLASEALLLRHYPLTEWSLLPYYRKTNGEIKKAASFDPKLIEKARMKDRHKYVGGTSLLIIGVLGISYRFITLPEPQGFGQSFGQDMGRFFFPIAGTVSLVSGLIILGK